MVRGKGNSAGRGGSGSSRTQLPPTEPPRGWRVALLPRGKIWELFSFPGSGEKQQGCPGAGWGRRHTERKSPIPKGLI